jgi:hypothetical protein
MYFSSVITRSMFDVILCRLILWYACCCMIYIAADCVLECLSLLSVINIVEWTVEVVLLLVVLTQQDATNKIKIQLILKMFTCVNETKFEHKISIA